MEYEIPGVIWRAVPALKLRLKYSEEGLHFPRPRLNEKAALLDGVSQSQSSLRGMLLLSVTQSCPTLSDPTDSSMPGLYVPHHLPEFAQVHVHCIDDAIQPSHPLMPSSPSALNLSHRQGLCQ